MPKKHRIAIYSYLFKGESTPRATPPLHPHHPPRTPRSAIALPPTHAPRTLLPLPTPSTEGVLSCQKDVKKPKHHEMDLPNLHVVKAMLSLKSRGYVREVFNWCVGLAHA